MHSSLRKINKAQYEKTNSINYVSGEKLTQSFNPKGAVPFITRYTVS